MELRRLTTLLRSTLSHRTFHTSPSTLAIRPPTPTTSTLPTPKPRQSPTETDQLLSWTKTSSSTSHPSHHKSPSAQTPGPSPSLNSLSEADERLLNGGNSAHDLLSSLSITSASRTPRTTLSNPSTFSPFRSYPVSSNTNLDLPPQKATEVLLRLGPPAGRTQTIGAGVDVARGFRLLEASCGRNKVKVDANNQRFHERGGLKRKRLRRVRWRRKFMEGFRSTVGRVKELKEQGW